MKDVTHDVTDVDRLAARTAGPHFDGRPILILGGRVVAKCVNVVGDVVYEQVSGNDTA